MGSARSGRSRIDVAELRRAERMLAAGQPVDVVAGVVGIDRKTARRIAAGEHPEQTDPHFTRCPACGAMTRQPCAICLVAPVDDQAEQLSDRIRRAAPEETAAELPPIPDPPARLGQPWRIGAIVGRSASGKSLAVRSWFPGASSAPLWPANVPIVDACRAPSASTVLHAFDVVGLRSPRQWIAPASALSAGERARADLVRVCLARRTLAVADPFLAALAGPEANRLAARVGWAVRRGLLGTRRLLICTQSEAIAEAISPDFWIDCPRFRLRPDRRAVR